MRIYCIMVEYADVLNPRLYATLFYSVVLFALRSNVYANFFCKALINYTCFFS